MIRRFLLGAALALGLASGAPAQVGPLPGMPVLPPPQSSAAAGPSVSYVTSVNSNTATTSYTFTATALGTPDSTRLVIAAIHTGSGGGATVTSVTIGGVTASATVSNTGVVQARTYLYQAAVPTGTTGDIVVNLAANPAPIDVDVYSAYNLASNTAGATANGTASPITLNTVSGGILVAAATFNGSALSAATWTGPTGDVFTPLTSNSRGAAAAHLAPTTTSSPQSVAVSATGSVTSMSMVAATWN
jgi:hypothetical protein